MTTMGRRLLASRPWRLLATLLCVAIIVIGPANLSDGAVRCPLRLLDRLYEYEGVQEVHIQLLVEGVYDTWYVARNVPGFHDAARRFLADVEDLFDSGTLTFKQSFEDFIEALARNSVNPETGVRSYSQEQIAKAIVEAQRLRFGGRLINGVIEPEAGSGGSWLSDVVNRGHLYEPIAISYMTRNSATILILPNGVAAGDIAPELLRIELNATSVMGRRVPTSGGPLEGDFSDVIPGLGLERFMDIKARDATFSISQLEKAQEWLAGNASRRYMIVVESGVNPPGSGTPWRNALEELNDDLPALQRILVVSSGPF